MIFDFFHTILTQPLLNVLIWFHNVLPGNDVGFAIIALTVVIRLILFPSFQKSLKAQKALQDLQPDIQEIKEKHKGDREAEAKATMEFYKEKKVNPFSSCLPLLVQLPILLALFRVFLVGLEGGDLTPELYGFVADPGQINVMFLGLFNLSESNLILALLAGAFQFIQSKMMMSKRKPVGTDPTAKIMNAQLLYFMPIITIVISMTLPSGLALYWIVSTLFAIGQQYYIMRGNNGKSNPPAVIEQKA